MSEIETKASEAGVSDPSTSEVVVNEVDESTAMATASDETPVFFPVGEESVFGILTRPTVTPNGICAVHLVGKGPSIATVGRGRMSVLLARRLSSLGYHSFRIEYQGTGDSTGKETGWSIIHPNLDELKAALAWLRAQGMSRVILIGTCGGARMALEAARIEKGIEGIVMLLPPMRDTEPWRRYDTLPVLHLVKRLFQPRHLAALTNKGRRKMYMERARSDIFASKRGKSVGPKPDQANGANRGNRENAENRVGTGKGQFEWIGPDALDGLDEMVTAQVPILMYFGTDDNDYRDWVQATKGPAGPVLDRAGDLVKIVVVDGRYYDNASSEMSARITSSIAEHMPSGGGGNGAKP